MLSMRPVKKLKTIQELLDKVYKARYNAALVERTGDEALRAALEAEYNRLYPNEPQRASVQFDTKDTVRKAAVDAGKRFYAWCSEVFQVGVGGQDSYICKTSELRD